MIHRPFTCTKSHCMYYAGQLEVWSLQNPFSFSFLLSWFPLSSLSLMNSNPPVPSLLPLTYKFLIENPVSLHLFLEFPFTLLLQFLRYCCIMKSQTTLWAQSVLLVFSCLLFCWLPFEKLNLWFSPDCQWQSVYTSHSLPEHNDFKMICPTSHFKWSASILPMTKVLFAVYRSQKRKRMTLLTSLITFLPPCWLFYSKTNVDNMKGK